MESEHTEESREERLPELELPPEASSELRRLLDQPHDPGAAAANLARARKALAEHSTTGEQAVVVQYIRQHPGASSRDLEAETGIKVGLGGLALPLNEVEYVGGGWYPKYSPVDPAGPIRKRLTAAAPGPWTAVDLGWKHAWLVESPHGAIARDVPVRADAELIANAPTDLAILLDALAATQQRLQATLEDAERLVTERDAVRREVEQLGRLAQIVADMPTGETFGYNVAGRQKIEALRAALAREER